MPSLNAIDELIASTRWLDTHEHLLEEATRLRPPSPEQQYHPCDDWSYLFIHYAADDLASSGLTTPERNRLFSTALSPVEKWAVFEPYWRRTRNTGYMRAVAESVRRLFGLELSAATVDAISEAMQELKRPGFYRTVLTDAAGVESCQVNSLESTFCVTEYPDLLPQDLNIGLLCLPEREKLDEWQTVSGISVQRVEDMLGVIDSYFSQFAKDAVAVKLPWAYQRSLAVGKPDLAAARQAWELWIAGSELNEREIAPLQDFLFRHALRLAADAGLPVKIHTGYFVGNDRMPLGRVRDNLSDLVPLIVEHPELDFVLMHMAYPYQHEMIAVAKHFRNAYADLCWAWIIDPVSTKEFVRRFLATAPASKLLCFGGDYMVVENVVGHAALAREGLAGALKVAIADGTLTLQQAAELVPELMHGNARRVFRTAPGPQQA